MKPMLFEYHHIDELPDLAADEQIALEQKCDGVRLLVEVTPAGCQFFGANGTAISFAAATQWFSKLEDQLRLPDPDFAVTLDGELMIEDGTYWVFDLPYLRFADRRLSVPGETEFSDRRRMLEEIRTAFRPELRLVPHAWSPADKIALVQAVIAVGGEGFMAKRLDAPYQPGVRVSHSVKAKFEWTADCVVMDWERGTGTGHADLGVYDAAGTLVRVGGCSLIGKPEVHRGLVVEVKFAHFRGAMIQPRMMRTRPDKRPEQCTFDQFRPYSKEVV